MRARVKIAGTAINPRPSMPNAPRPCLLSIVVPCFNEEQALPELLRRLSAVGEDIPAAELELVFVDDGSRDGTLEALREVAAEDARVRVLALSRNFGQMAATTAGLAAATGDAVVLIDADMQDPPEVIPEMVARWREGADVAYGQRTAREGEPAWKVWSSKAFTRFFNRASNIPLPTGMGDFRLLDRNAVDAFLAMPERDRCHRVMFAWTGFRQKAVPFHRPPRTTGTTGYTLRGLVRVALDGVLSFSLAPLRLATWIGLAMVAATLAGLAWGLIGRIFTATPVAGETLLFIAVLLVGGLQLLAIGVLGEYVGRIYGEVKRRPLYIVRERLGFPESGPEGEPALADQR